MNLISYIRALLVQWEECMMDSDDFVRLVRAAIQEEDAIEAAEKDAKAYRQQLIDAILDEPFERRENA